MKDYFVLLLSHGSFAGEAIKSIEMLMGEQENIKALGLAYGMGADEFQNNIEMLLNEEEIKNAKQVIIFTDIPGGTPNSAAIKVTIGKPNFTVISGFNLPILIELLCHDKIRECDINELIDKSKEAIMNFTEKTNQHVKNESLGEDL